MRYALTQCRDDDEPLVETLKRAHRDGMIVGIYGNPVEPGGLYPATLDKALDACAEDPSLVYLVDREVN